MPKPSLEWADESAPDVPRTEDERDDAYLPPSLVGNEDFDNWLKQGYELAVVVAASQWEIAAWIMRGEVMKEVAAFKHSVYCAAADIFHISPSTAKQYAYVARSVSASIRIDALSFAHHQLVAGMPEDEQKAALEEMVLSKSTVGEARSRLKYLAIVNQPEANQPEANQPEPKPSPKPRRSKPAITTAEERADTVTRLCLSLHEVMKNRKCGEVQPQTAAAMRIALESIRFLVAEELRLFADEDWSKLDISRT